MLYEVITRAASKNGSAIVEIHLRLAPGRRGALAGLHGERGRADRKALNPIAAANMESTGALEGFAVIDLVFGLLLVLLCAATRNNFV